MRAHLITADGPRLTDIATPVAGPGMVLVRIAANALNRIDLKLATGDRHGAVGGVGTTLGLEWAGEIVEVGEGVDGHVVGERVMGIGGGAFAEFVAAYPFQFSPIPRDMGYEQAVCFPVALRTMHDAIVTAGGLKAGDSVLIQGASSGVGLVGMQIAKALGASLVIGSSTTPARVAMLGEYGADLAIDSRDAGWVETVLAATDGAGVDIVVDQVAGDLLNRTLLATRIGGRIVNVGRLGGNDRPFDAETHALRRIALVGVTFRTRTPAEIAAIGERMVADLHGAVSAGVFRVPVAARFEFDDLGSALTAMRDNTHFGKIVLVH